MHYSFRIGDRKTAFRQQDRDLPDDGAARIEALTFAASVLGDASSAAARARDLVVEVRGADGEIRITAQIRSSGAPARAAGDDEVSLEGEGHPS
jgi:hypothetical protein